MTLPYESDRAVAQTREFLLRLASPYVEGGIKGIRREVRAEALALLRHYPRSYARSDEKRSDGDTSGATVHQDCTLTTARIECETSVWMPAGESLSQKCDYPVADNRVSGDKLGKELAQDAADTLTDSERAAVSRAIETLDNFQTTGGCHSAVEDDAATLERLLERMA